MTTETAVARHDRMVREERDQAERVRSDSGEEPDLWRPHARRFGGEGESAPHPAVPALLEIAEPEWRVIDVGAGGGRITLAVAAGVREMVAVEPSPAMREVLLETAARLGIENLSVVPATWEEATVDPADLVYAANVTYGIMAIEPFLRQLDRLATRRAALVAFADPPQQRVAPFWTHVHGEERLRLPCRAELLDVLRELGADPQENPLPPHEPQPLGSREEARTELRRRLFVGAGTDADARLEAALDALTVERDGVLWIRDEPTNHRSVIWWDAGALTIGESEEGDRDGR